MKSSSLDFCFSCYFYIYLYIVLKHHTLTPTYRIAQSLVSPFKKKKKKKMGLTLFTGQSFKHTVPLQHTDTHHLFLLFTVLGSGLTRVDARCG